MPPPTTPFSAPPTSCRALRLRACPPFPLPDHHRIAPSATVARAYQQVWTERGSPLLFHSVDLAAGVARELGQGWRVVLGMRYGSPDLLSALDQLHQGGVDRIVVLPLYPQYASSSTGSSLERLYTLAASRPAVPALSSVPAFHADPAFLDAQAAVTRPTLQELFQGAPGEGDHLLFSFHGLPERQVRATDPTGAHCLATADCCDTSTLANQDCYRHQCFQTARALAERLSLPPGSWSVSFQSRLGRTPWIQPFTDEHVVDLYQRGVRRLAVATPSFVADCLETVEEVGIRLREQWRGLGGEAFARAPCLNADPAWVSAVADLARRAVGRG